MKAYGPTEQQIQQTIINYLRYKGYYVQRLNAGAIRVDTRLIRMAAKGTPDIFAFKEVYPDGAPNKAEVDLLFIEVKRPGNNPTPAQTMMMQELESYGARCVVAHSLEEVEKFV